MRLNYLNNDIFINYKPFLQGRDLKKDFNIFQVTGFPHYEVVSSRVLEFFFDPNESHGLGTLLLEALSTFLVSENDVQSFINIDWKVEREVITGNKNRIDVLLKSDDYVVAIENKIYATEYNDLNDYLNHIKREFNIKNNYGVVLSLHTTTFNERGWKNITYQQFFECVNKILGSYFIGSNTKGLMFLHDFIENLKILKEGNRLNMSNPKQLMDFEHFIEDHYQSIIDMDTDLKIYKKECGQLVNGILNLFENSEIKHEINNTLGETLIAAEEKAYLNKIYKFTPSTEPLAALVIDTKITQYPNLSLAIDFEFGYDKVVGRSGLILKIFIRGEKGARVWHNELTNKLTQIVNDDYKKVGNVIHYFCTSDIWGKTDLELIDLVKEKYMEIIISLHNIRIELGDSIK
ncbi:PD-(D/E)XK nuclease family protein [Salinicoccus sp. HZC-1]|uniref:PDDEXK-like family protein n=1 Tax=Salinicoccus sp. HZC-1 TaxID=3385497 RepID=UPI00398ABB28